MLRSGLPYNAAELKCPSVHPMKFIGIDSPLYDGKIIYRLFAYRKKINKCRIWKRHLNAGKYGTVTYKGKTELAHRIVWLLSGRNLPRPGKSLDHIGCGDPSCIDIDHLEEVTIRENTLRSNCPAAINARKSSCNQGHEFTPENTIMEKGNMRRCRICRDIPNHIKLQKEIPISC